ncbi:MAG TPA: hypothetical protein VKU87_01625, partial [Thermomicrobiaceae bacterium]|nr:hypothetical protein [Thermomicrobiaceae bacterium]
STTRLAWAIWLATLLVWIACVGLFDALSHTAGNGTMSPLTDTLYFIVFWAFGTVGALVISRQPANPLGWVFIGMDIAGLGADAQNYAIYALAHPSARLPGVAWSTWGSSLAGGPLLYCFVAAMLLLFPTGRPLTARWRTFLWLDLASVILILLGALTPGPIHNFDYASIPNPVGIARVGSLLNFLNGIGFVFGVGAALAGAVSLILRLRRSYGEERQQLKWFVFAGAVMAVVSLTGPIFWTWNLIGPAWTVVFALGILSIPVASGFAILRYRLWDIDRIINRTLVYGCLTAILVGIYAGGVLLLQYLLDPITQRSDLAIALTTLAVAALFNPVRRRVQELVDRRFYRQRYDAAHALDRFGKAARSEIDLEQLTRELAGVISETVQPEHLSVWLRSPEASR